MINPPSPFRQPFRRLPDSSSAGFGSNPTRVFDDFALLLLTIVMETHMLFHCLSSSRIKLHFSSLNFLICFWSKQRSRAPASTLCLAVVEHRRMSLPHQWFCDLVWAGRMCGRQNLTPTTGSRACASEHVCAGCGGARLPPYYILQHNCCGLKLVLGDWRQLPCRYGFGCNREDRCYFQHGVEAQQWKRVASAMSIGDAETYVWKIRPDGPNTELYPALKH